MGTNSPEMAIDRIILIYFVFVEDTRAGKACVAQAVSLRILLPTRKTSMKSWLVLMSIALSGCIPIRVIPKYNPDIYLAPPVIQGYQKTDTIGHTDTEQRWKDLQACGVKNYSDGRLDLSVAYSGMTTQDVIERRKAISTCMEEKGYVIYNRSKCIKNKKLTGLCN
ncbi:MAG: hypothetical protein KA346_03790 [Neisseriaceae bacterium]|nr:hypothetical protein [Neisseriaceae bacterium]